MHVAVFFYHWLFPISFYHSGPYNWAIACYFLHFGSKADAKEGSLGEVEQWSMSTVLQLADSLTLIMWLVYYSNMPMVLFFHMVPTLLWNAKVFLCIYMHFQYLTWYNLQGTPFVPSIMFRIIKFEDLCCLFHLPDDLNLYFFSRCMT